LLRGSSFTLEIRQIVIPAKAGIQFFQDLLDSRLHGNDKVGVFFKALNSNLSAGSVFGEKLKTGVILIIELWKA